MSYQVSVVIPTIPSRADFLRERCLPSVYENGAAEVIVDDGPGNGSAKRNRGAARATMPYILFVDDDSVLRHSCIDRMVRELESRPSAAFAYSDYDRFLAPGIQSSLPAGRFSAGEFDGKRLRALNYINTTSLLRRELCPSWDESLERFQDWDFWLTVVKAGGVGAYIQEALYELWQIDLSVSTAVKANPYIEMVVAKHRLNLE